MSDWTEEVDESEKTLMKAGSLGPWKCPHGLNFRQQFPSYEPKPPGETGAENPYLTRMDARRRSSARADPPEPGPYSSDLVPEYYINELISGHSFETAGTVTAVPPVVVDVGESTPPVGAKASDPNAWPHPTYEFSVNGLTGTITRVESINWPYSVLLVDEVYDDGVLQTVSDPYEDT